MNYNLRKYNDKNDIPDKHWLLQMKPDKLPIETLTLLDEFYRSRWESLLAVDELVLEVVQSLKMHHNFLDNTYIIFTSDNGYHIGQFAQAFDKRQPYETDIRVPLLVAGPNIAPKTVIHESALLIDLLPTFLDWSESCYLDKSIDGISLASVLEGNFNSKYERKFLVEYWGEGNEYTFNPECPWKKSDRLSVCLLPFTYFQIYRYFSSFFKECTLNAQCHCQDSWNNTFACVRHLAFDLDKIYCEFRDNEVNLLDYRKVH